MVSLQRLVVVVFAASVGADDCDNDDTDASRPLRKAAVFPMNLRRHHLVLCLLAQYESMWRLPSVYE